MNRSPLLLICAAIVAFSTTANADLIFSNNFEDGNFAPEVGTWDFTAGSTATSVVPTTVTSPNGDNVGLLDQTNPVSGNLDATLNLTDTGLLTGGNTVTLSFDVAARRTNGNTKTIFVDALDSTGAIVNRFVLGDANAFGNGGTDRQRIGYDAGSAGNDNTENTPFSDITGNGANVAQTWFGADGTPASFGGAASVSTDAQVSITIGASTFSVDTDKAFNGLNYTASGIANYDSGTYADIASFQLTSAGGNYGIYLDNIQVNATLVAVPEPSSSALLGIAALGFCGFRRRRS